MRQAANQEEPIGRSVGRRLAALNGLDVTRSNIAASVAWRHALGGVRIPRGVFRFATHEEADQWMWKMISRPPPS